MSGTSMVFGAVHPAAARGTACSTRPGLRLRPRRGRPERAPRAARAAPARPERPVSTRRSSPTSLRARSTWRARCQAMRSAPPPCGDLGPHAHPIAERFQLGQQTLGNERLVEADGQVGHEGTVSRHFASGISWRGVLGVVPRLWDHRGNMSTALSLSRKPPRSPIAL